MLDSQSVLVSSPEVHTATNSVNPLRVLHVHSGNLYGGVETTLLTQVRHRDLCPSLEISFALCFSGRFRDELRAAGAAIHDLGAVRIRDLLSVRRARRNLKQLLRRENFDAVVTHSSWSQAVFGPAVRAARTPLFSYFHDSPKARHWLDSLARRIIPDLALCNSKFTEAGVSQLYPGVRTEIIYCPVAPPEDNYSDESLKLLRAELRTSDDATVIVQVSRMEAWKGHSLHLEALNLLRDLPGWVCWQVGGAQTPREKKYVQELKDKARDLGISERVRFLDQRSDVAKLMSAADIFCQPNTGPEPFGIVFIEALYAELPVVTADMGGPREIVDDSCGMLVPPGDVQALASTLRRLVREPSLRVRLGAAGPARARTLCDPGRQINQLNNAFASVVRRQQQVSA